MSTDDGIGVIVGPVEPALIHVDTFFAVTLICLASMPAAYDMARDRGRSTYAWLSWAMLLGPLALIALVFLGPSRASKAAKQQAATLD